MIERVGGKRLGEKRRRTRVEKLPTLIQRRPIRQILNPQRKHQILQHSIDMRTPLPLVFPVLLFQLCGPSTSSATAADAGVVAGERPPPRREYRRVNVAHARWRGVIRRRQRRRSRATARRRSNRRGRRRRGSGRFRVVPGFVQREEAGVV